MKRELRTKSAGTKVSEAELRVHESRAESAGLKKNLHSGGSSQYDFSGLVVHVKGS